jgi:hypothetical protein
MIKKDINILNKRAKFDYEFLAKYDAGIVLTGTEIKSAMFLMLFEMVYAKEILALLMDAPKYSLPVRLPKDK